MIWQFRLKPQASIIHIKQYKEVGQFVVTAFFLYGYISRARSTTLVACEPPISFLLYNNAVGFVSIFADWRTVEKEWHCI